MLTIEQILAAKEARTAEVPVPEWGGTVCVRRLTALEAIELYAQLKDIKGTPVEVAQQRLVAALALFLCDYQGNAIATIEPAQELSRKSAGPVNRIVTQGHRLNATDDNQVEAGAKNSEPSRDDSSPSV